MITTEHQKVVLLEDQEPDVFDYSGLPALEDMTEQDHYKLCEVVEKEIENEAYEPADEVFSDLIKRVYATV